MKHSVILANDSLFGNLCWPSVARLKDGRLVMVCSGHRLAHVCPFGKVVACVSEDDGKTWSEPITLIDTPLDDRDAGITPWGDGFLVTTFNNTRKLQLDHLEKHHKTDERKRLVRERLAQITDEDEATYLGASCYCFDSNFKEQYHMMLPLSAPHGMSLLNDGRLMYVGRAAANSCVSGASKTEGIGVIFSEDGKNFGEITWITLPTDTLPSTALFCEPHGIQLRDGTILIQIRLQGHDVDNSHFTIWQGVSTDGGKTFDTPKPLCIPDEPMYGAPPHLLECSDGTVVTVYGYRLKPYGERARISRDGGKTWSREIILRDDSPSGDLGYPATVECKNGELLTVYYQIPQGKENRAILATRWNPSDLL